MLGIFRTGALEQIGSGTTILTGDNDYSGGTTITHGTLQLGDGTATGSIAGNVSNNSSLVFNPDATTSLTLDGDISGSGAVEQIGSGTTVLTGSNSYTGGTLVSGGILRADSDNALADNTAYTVNGGTLDLNNHSLTMSSLSGAGGSIALGALGTAELTVNQANSTTYAGAITGAGGLTKAGWAA